MQFNQSTIFENNSFNSWNNQKKSEQRFQSREKLFKKSELQNNESSNAVTLRIFSHHDSLEKSRLIEDDSESNNKHKVEVLIFSFIS